MVITTVNYNSLEFDIPVFHTIVSNSKLDEYGNSISNYNGNYVYGKINMDRTVVNMEWTD